MNTPGTGQENLLHDFAQRLRNRTEGRRGAHVHLSRLKPANRRQHHIRIAVNNLEESIINFEGQLFLLSNNDIVFVTKGANLSDLDAIINRLRHLFAADPLAAAGELETSNVGYGRFATVYAIETQYGKFMELCEFLFEEQRKRQAKMQKIAAQVGDKMAESGGHPLTPQQLGRLEEVLDHTELSNIMRRQAVCTINEGRAPKALFYELFISIKDLALSVLPDVNLTSNRWLFQHLTQTLDRRILKILARGDDSSLFSSISMNLNVGTLLSQDFLEYDSSLRMSSRGTLVVELQMIDLMADFASYSVARDFVRDKGYRVCLDGITVDTLPFVDRQKMGVDLVKLNAPPEFQNGADNPLRPKVERAIEKIGRGRIVLCRCDNRQVIDSGQAMGINMFQGHYLDSALRQLNKTALVS